MFNSIEEVKNFLVWANKNGLKHIKLEGIEAEFSEVARAYATVDSQSPSQIASNSSQPEDSDDELLYFSSKP